MNGDFLTFGVLKRFRAKWKPVRVKKTRQNKRLEPGFDSITEMALVGPTTEKPASLVISGLWG
jgi:hypothetical protein